MGASAHPGEQSIFSPVGNHLGLEEGRLILLSSLWARKEGAEAARAAITDWHSNKTIDRLGTTSGNSVNLCGIKFVRAKPHLANTALQIQLIKLVQRPEQT